MKKYRCIPISISLPIIFAIYLLICSFIAYSSICDGDIGNAILFFVLAFTSLILALVTFVPSINRVEIGQNAITCLGFFSHNTFSLEYQKCNIGMDYHLQNGNKVWWIYLCYGYPTKYIGRNQSHHMNTVKIQPGFVKIMYSDEVYDALVAALPKKQKTSLTSARRCAGFEKQGSLFFKL